MRKAAKDREIRDTIINKAITNRVIIKISKRAIIKEIRVIMDSSKVIKQGYNQQNQGYGQGQPQGGYNQPPQNGNFNDPFANNGPANPCIG